VKIRGEVVYYFDARSVDEFLHVACTTTDPVVRVVGFELVDLRIEKKFKE
jgi:hypothetical protein